MQLSEEANIGFVFSVTRHPYLGLIIEPFLVEKTLAGNFSLSHQRLSASNVLRYSHLMTESDRDAVYILDEITPERLVKRFYRKGTIRPKEFFEKKCEEELFKFTIRPFIERKLWEALGLIDRNKIYSSNQTKNVTFLKLICPEEPATVLFHFKRTETETRYYATLKVGQDRIKLLNNGSLIISDPAVLIVEDKLVVVQEIDGKKLEPFFTKYYISVARRSEEIFFKKFGLELIEKFNVKSEGFDILQETHKASAILKLEKILDNKYGFILSFRYDGHLFAYHSKKMAHVLMEKTGDSFVFRKIRRSRDWEEHKREFVLSLGLKQVEGSVLEVPGWRHQGPAEAGESNKYVTLEWLNANKALLESRGIEVLQNLNEGSYFIGEANIRVEIEKQGDWFDISTRVWFGDIEVPFLKLKPNIMSGNREFRLPNGEIAIIPEAWMVRFESILQYDVGKEGIRLKQLHWGLLSNISEVEGIQTRLMGLRSFEEIREVELPVGFKGQLRDYQAAGFNWFYFLREYGFGGCLADDMGLGKTIQTLALLQKEKETQALVKQEEISPVNVPVSGQISIFDQVDAPNGIKAVKPSRTSLLVVPTSLIYNWVNESRRFTPELSVFVHIGQTRPRSNELFGNYDLILSTYGTVRNDEQLFLNFHFHYIILDESQNIKNPNSMVSKTMRNLRCNYRLALTGTPIENSIRDLWSQITFVNPGLLGGLKHFESHFVVPVEKEGDEQKMMELRALIKPFILRRTKQQVAKELPEKFEQILYVDMSPEQEELYEKTKSAFRNEILKNLETTGLGKARFHIIAGLTRLRQIANHPLLADSHYKGASGKFLELLERTHTAIESGHKILIYSQFVEQLKIIRAALDESGTRYAYFDGSFSAKERQAQVKMFQETPEIPLFLVSLRAGGTGLTLTAADYVFIVDPWWNPSIERQAVDRTHRIGQTKNIFSYKLITRNTVEEKILNLQRRKMNLASELVVTEDSFYKSLSAEDIKNILE